MKLHLLLSLALTAIATPTPEEIFKRAASKFCLKAKSGCGNSQESKGVQNYCSSYLSLPPRKTKTYVNLESTTVYTATSTTTYTTFLGGSSASFFGSPGHNTRTSWATITAANAPTTVVTSTFSGGTNYVYPSQCGQNSVTYLKRDIVEARQTAAASQPVCFNKYAKKTEISSACGCFKLTATVPTSTLIDSTTTISTFSLASVSLSISSVTARPKITDLKKATTTVHGPQIITSTTTISTVTSTTTTTNGVQATAFALMDGASGQYAGSDADVASFKFSQSNAAAFTLDSNGGLAFTSGYFAGTPGWQITEGSPDYIRFGNPNNYGGGFTWEDMQCSIQSNGGQCSLVCSVHGWSQNCIYNSPGDSRTGSWVIGYSGLPWCNYVSPPLIMPLSSSASTQ